MIKGILFDFDGVLVKSIEDHYKAWRKVLKNYGVDLTPKQYYPLEGTKMSKIAQSYCHTFGLGNISEEIVAKKEQYYIDDNHFELYPGVEELIDELGKKIKLGIVTSSDGPRMHKTNPSEFLEKFDVIISGDMSEYGKPHPEPFIKGLKELGIRKDECIVIENAPLGVQSAKLAGIYTIGITSTVAAEILSACDEVVNSFKELRSTEKIKKVLKESRIIERKI